MLPTMAWASKSGAWAAQVDEAEEKDGDLGPVQPPAPAAPVPASLGGEEAFPSLGEAVTKKISKRDRKAKQTVSLKDFQSGAYKAPRPSAKPASDADILASLPSGPRMRDDDDARPTMGGAFREYGGDRGGRGASPWARCCTAAPGAIMLMGCNGWWLPAVLLAAACLMQRATLVCVSVRVR